MRAVCFHEVDVGLKEKGNKVAVICSSGLACTVYDRGVASTVHSHYGLQTADLPWDKVVDRAKSNALVCSRIKDTDSIIWDEISMSSARTLELTNVLEHEISLGDNFLLNRPFGGKQMILVGDFLQLKPVPSAFDNGDYVFCSLVFRITFPHRNELTIILRQREEDVEFLGALRELRLGQCSEKSHRFLSALSRNLDANTSANATHIFFKKLNASLHNFKVLRSLPGEFIDIHAEIDGESPHIDITASCPAERVVRLKKNCRVMLLWNKSEDLRNGSQGVFLDMETASVAVVRFPGVGVVNVGKETWLKRDRYGVVVGSVTQVPLVPCYAITCHKSQGQTVPAVIVHCSQEFVSSLTYVALSRVKSADHLQVINFKPKFLAAAPQAVTSECWTTSPEEIEKVDLTCCRNQALMDSSLFCATDRTFGNHNDNIPEEALVNFPLSAVDDDFLKNIFEEECQQIISLVEVNATLQEHEEELSQPPESLNRNDLLSSLKSPEARAGTTGHAKNLLLDSLQLTEDEYTHEKLIAFLKVIWNHLFNIVDNHTAENLDETITKITRQQFTAATGDLHAFFKSQEYKAYLHDLFGVSALTKVQSMVGGDVVLSLYTRFLAHLADKVHQDGHDVEDEEPFSVWNMTDEGKAKVRYVVGAGLFEKSWKRVDTISKTTCKQRWMKQCSK
ncbi:hypothetical protein QZH41_007048 [Actinostola sp. cb2023]|nr:hypothetical protein QZH41_007048 [Actinostola sp. cb2023]